MSEPNRERAWSPGCTVALAALVALFVGFGAVLVACGNSLAHIGDGISVPEFAKTPASIPIPHTSCPSLRAVHLTATDAGRPWATVLDQPTRGGRSQTFAAQLGPLLARFDAALRRAVTRVPAPVAAQLREVIRQVELGRAQLAHAKSPSAGTALIDNAVGGYVALNVASNLVGDTCGFTLAPALDVVLAPTTTVPR